MAKKAERGTKRTCQSASCGARFYDLARDPITCPVCGTLYVIATSPQGAAGAVADDRARRSAKKPEFVAPVAASDAPEAEAEDVLEEAADGDEAIAADDDETFLEEEEEDGGDVSGIIGGPVGEEGEEA
jgi:uncharacterized protein (TIGR02300 family)